MGSSNFLPFNPSLNNAEADAAYAADTLRISGGATGAIIPALFFNKALAQPTLLAAALAQAMANKGYTISDSNYTNLIAALANIRTTADEVPGIISVTYASSLSFNAAAATGFEVVLTGNVASSTLSNFAPGQLLIFILVQDSIGGRSFSWPSAIASPPGVSETPNAVTVAAFIVGTDSSVLLLNGSATSFQAQNSLTTTRHLGVTYQNTGATPRLVTVSLGATGAWSAVIVCDSSSSPSTQVGSMGGLGASASCTFLVLPGFYYYVYGPSGSPIIDNWTEWQ